jgi:ketosteroid isomerase-like protein
MSASGDEHRVDDLDRVVEQYHVALDEFMKGNYAPAKKLFSEREDVTLGNPFGPFARGPAQLVETMERAASHYRDGRAVGFDTVSTYVTAELAYIVEVERLESKVGGRDDLAPVNLRVTSIFRREDGHWRLAHRHADPITTRQPADSVIKTM